MPETFKKAPPKIVESIPRVENQGNIENNSRAVQKIAEIGKDKRPERGFIRVTAEPKIEGAEK